MLCHVTSQKCTLSRLSSRRPGLPKHATLLHFNNFWPFQTTKQQVKVAQQLLIKACNFWPNIRQIQSNLLHEKLLGNIFRFFNDFLQFFCKNCLENQFWKGQEHAIFHEKHATSMQLCCIGGIKISKFFPGASAPGPPCFYGGLRPPKTLICNFYLWTIGNPAIQCDI